MSTMTADKAVVIDRLLIDALDKTDIVIPIGEFLDVLTRAEKLKMDVMQLPSPYAFRLRISVTMRPHRRRPVRP